MPPGQDWSDGHNKNSANMSNEDSNNDDSGFWKGLGKSRKTDLSNATLRRDVESRGGTVVAMEFEGIKEIGKGSFGTITKMRARRYGRESEIVAVKRPEPSDCDVIEKNVLSSLQHKNIVSLKYHFIDKGLCNLVLELVDDGNLYDFLHAKGSYDRDEGLGIYTELFMFQLFRGLAYCHSHDIIHRDLKPENLLISKRLGTLKIADFGCACYLHEHGRRACYVGTRDFRAPELIMEAKRYSSKVDVWSCGVILSELILKKPVFYKEGTKDSLAQLRCIFEYLGTPTADDCEGMHVKQPKSSRVLRPRSFRGTFAKSPAKHNLETFLHLIERILVYKPKDRYTAWQCCAHPYFEKLKQPTAILPSGRSLPTLFDFTQEEFETMPKGVAQQFEQFQVDIESLLPTDVSQVA